MIRSQRHIVPLLAASLALAACGSDDPPPAAAPTTAAAPTVPNPAPAPDESMTESMTEESMTDAMTEESMTESMTEESMTEESMTESMTDESMTDESMTDAMSDVAFAAWQTLPITDVSGETFTLADLTGTPVVVEFFATWCPKCRSQLAVTNAAAATLGAEAHVIALSVETDLHADDVAAYASGNGFDSIRFAVMTPEMLAAVVDAFGPTAANAPSTPKVVIDASGIVGELSTGSESADALVAAARG